jgi:hypothetical protein
MILHDSWTEALAQHPETGMGFQVLLLRGTYALTEHAIVLNGSHVYEPTPGSRIVGDENLMVADAEMRSALQGPIGTVHFKVLSRAEAADALGFERAADHGPASEPPG